MMKIKHKFFGMLFVSMLLFHLGIFIPSLSLVHAWSSSTGIIEPLYCDPYSHDPSRCAASPTFTWQSINNTKNSYSHVPFFAISNPNDGIISNPPTCSYDGSTQYNLTRDYQNGIGNLTKTGVVVLGYVDTIYDSNGTLKPYSESVHEINNWISCYPNIKGIFLDDMQTTYNSTNLQYYQNLTNYIHDNDIEDLTYSYGNTGCCPDNNLNSTVDTMNIYEGNSSGCSAGSNCPDNATLQGGDVGNWYLDFPKNDFSFLLFGKASLPTSAWIKGKSMYVNNMFITSGTLPNPWNTIPSQTYLNTLAADLNFTSILITVNSVNTSMQTLTGYYITVDQSGNQLPSGFTPLNYNATTGIKYVLTADISFGDCKFDKWQDTGSTDPSRTVIANSTNVTYTAVYENNGGTCQ